MQYNFSKLNITSATNLVSELIHNTYVSFYVDGFKVSVSVDKMVATFVHHHGGDSTTIASFDFVTKDSATYGVYPVVTAHILPMIRELILS